MLVGWQPLARLFVACEAWLVLLGGSVPGCRAVAVAVASAAQAPLPPAGAALVRREDRGSLPCLGSSTHKAVVNDFHRKANTSWLHQSMQADLVGINGGSRLISESIPWLEWIRANYHNLPEYVAFLHGDQTSWHSTLNACNLAQDRPKNVHMLSHCFFPEAKYCDSKEKWGVDLLYKSFFNMSCKDAAQKWEMTGKAHKYPCCSEMVVAKKAIRQVDLSVYTAVLDIMKRTPSQPWGYIWERTWQNLFSKSLRPTHEVLLSLKVLSRSPPAALTQLQLEDLADTASHQAEYFCYN